ncbi:helix-turn-helix domain-containing protein [Streptococcus parauberis]|uniref:DNA-binding helix-turn-helix protein n=1 Tax=Streptococcus parauberis NCFD 2020 TaxID=873447 RepID=F1YZG0_9STRE|nr:helix-turn-helix transcriptional regulator [Streptococcus parauberis]EGE53409.1 DNA-binding helix-turn-helix protein [Streptococcus parauberis NCFD 2020]
MGNKSNILGENLKKLRKLFGHTQDELAEILHFSKGNVISYYEKGERYPDQETLEKISDYFHISLDDLLNQELSEPGRLSNYFEKMKNDIVGSTDDFFALFPKVNFSSGGFPAGYQEVYSIHESISADVYMNPTEKINICLDKYQMLYEQYNDSMLLVNVLNIYFYVGISNYAEPISGQVELLLKDKLNSKDFTKKTAADLLKKQGNNEELNESIFELLVHLRGENSTRDYFEYYYALTYIFNLTNHGEDSIQNDQFGLQLMMDFALFGNVYSYQYLKYIQKYNI